LRIGGWAFFPKLCAVQLQAADWFAYEVYKHMDNRVVAGVRREIRKSAWDLLRPSVDIAHYWNMERINKWLVDATAGGLIKVLEDREAMLRTRGREDLM
jgi:hypothetical protein